MFENPTLLVYSNPDGRSLGRIIHTPGFGPRARAAQGSGQWASASKAAVVLALLGMSDHRFHISELLNPPLSPFGKGETKGGSLAPEELKKMTLCACNVTNSD